MSLYKKFATNGNAERDGFRFVIGANDDGSEIAFHLARNGGANMEAKADMVRRYKRVENLSRTNALSEEKASAIIRENFCATILKGWENVTDKDGNHLPFSYDNAIKIMQDLPDVQAILIAEATNSANYLAASVEDDAKN